MFGIHNGQGRNRWLLGTLTWPVFPMAIVVATVFSSSSQAISSGESAANASLSTTRFSAQSVLDGVFTTDQVSQGEQTFREACMACHATDEFSGVRFSFRWSGLTEFKCVEFVEELVYGHLRKEQLVRRWEGDLGQLGQRLIIDVTRTLPVELR